MGQTGYLLRLLSVVVGLIGVPVSVGSVHAEIYVAGQVGYTAPNDLSDVQTVQGISGLGVSDLQLHDSVVYGAKLGYYFSGVKWLGVETELFHTSPHAKQQPVTLAGMTTTSPGFNLNVTTWAINALVRYPGEKFQPYAGVGLGVFFAEAKFQGQSDKDTVPGLNALAGLRYFLTERVALFAEYKYNRAAFEFTNAIGIKADYSANHFLGGLSVHF